VGHLDTISADDISQEFHLRAPPDALGRFDCQLVLRKPLENPSDKIVVFLERFRIDKDVVHINDEPEVDHITEDMVHHILEGCGGISKPEWHDVELVKALSSAEGGFPFIALTDPNESESALEVHFGEPLSALNPILEFLHQWEGVSVWDRNAVDHPIVDAEPKATSVWLWDEEDR
jgi:hypothetical protein